VASFKNKVKEMRRVSFRVICVTVSCLITSLLCGCNLFVTDKDKFYLNKNLDYDLTWIDLDKAGKDIVIPAKIEDKKIRVINLADPYFTRIDSLDISQVKELESFRLNLFDPKNKSKLKELDFSKNKKLRLIEIGQTKALKNIKFNNTCETIYLKGTSVNKVDLKKLESLDDFSYFDGPLEELDISNNPNLEQIWIKNANIKVLDVSKNPKLKHIIVDEGTQIIGPTNAQIEYNKRKE
jgi:hypothetical protein